ncbi:annexin-B12-like [Ixodes scapularis]|uniref:annexin-B12-like n=1 Tax=Ixodes scapularis TaxID=6945 RepID=UPI001C3947F0|nr:annexin-B12-like [Ixodes scapularis]
MGTEDKDTPFLEGQIHFLVRKDKFLVDLAYLGKDMADLVLDMGPASAGEVGELTCHRYPPAFRAIRDSEPLFVGCVSRWEQQGTIRPHRNFNAVEDANALRKAMKGFGTDEKAIIAILCKRSSDQRMQIVAMYKQCHGRDLIKDIRSELRGRFEDVMVGLLYPMHEYLARELRRAIAGLGTDEDCLVEILCTRSNSDINAIKQVYQQIFNKDLERDIIGDTSGHFRRVLVSMCNGAREEGLVPDPFRARNDAHLLHQAGAARWGTDESTFNRILASQSYEQLKLVFREYHALTNHTIMEAINSEMSGDLRAAFLAIVKSVVNIQYYFAEKLYKAMKGMGTSDKALVRIIVSRCEIDLVQIKEEYQRNFNVPLENAIQSDTSGDYRQALLALVHGN